MLPHLVLGQLGSPQCWSLFSALLSVLLSSGQPVFVVTLPCMESVLVLAAVGFLQDLGGGVQASNSPFQGWREDIVY